MVDKNILISRMEKIDKHLNKIKKFGTISYEEFLKNEDAQDIVEYNLFQIVNHIIDMIEHIVVDEEYGLPASAYDAAKILFEKKILDELKLAMIKKMIGFRNVAGHNYIGIDKKTVHFLLTEGERDVKGLISVLSGKYL